jgi:hypothetical protein
MLRCPLRSIRIQLINHSFELLLSILRVALTTTDPWKRGYLNANFLSPEMGEYMSSRDAVMGRFRLGSFINETFNSVDKMCD